MKIFNCIQILFSLCQTHFMPAAAKDLEILALHSQLALFQQKTVKREIPKPRPTPRFRRLWVALSKIFPEWKSALTLVKPETVMRWHKTAFSRYWRRKSKGGRPRISTSTIALIKRLHRENPLLSPAKIHERLLLLNVADAPAPNAIAKYIRPAPEAPSGKRSQSWQAFLKNHAKGVWAMDYAVVPSFSFKVLYILLIVSHDRRKIERFAVTQRPAAAWLIQQIREATPFGRRPKYLVHDNDAAFRGKEFQTFLTNSKIQSKPTSYRSPWQNGVCERLVGVLRRELLNYVIPLSQRHLERLLAEYVYYCNHVRPHQTLGGDPPVQAAMPPESSAANTFLFAKSILGGLYHEYRKAA